MPKIKSFRVNVEITYEDEGVETFKFDYPSKKDKLIANEYQSEMAYGYSFTSDKEFLNKMQQISINLIRNSTQYEALNKQNKQNKK